MKKNEEITKSNRDTHKDRNGNGQIHLIMVINKEKTYIFTYIWRNRDLFRDSYNEKKSKLIIKSRWVILVENGSRSEM